MSSQAQIEANRLNAQKSLGPKTMDGKQAASQNALKHGLRSTRVLVPSDDPAQYDLHRSALLEELNPATPMEHILADRIVALSWQLSRATSLQSQSIESMMSQVAPPKQFEYTDDQLSDYHVLKELGMSQSEFGKLNHHGGAKALIARGRQIVDQLRQSERDRVNDQLKSNTLGSIAVRDFSQTRVLERLVGYERKIESSLYKTREQLTAMQCRRMAISRQQQNAVLDNFLEKLADSEDSPSPIGKNT